MVLGSLKNLSMESSVRQCFTGTSSYYAELNSSRDSEQGQLNSWFHQSLTYVLPVL